MEAIKADPVLSEFVRYCINHPEERFWQALKNWSGYSGVFVEVPNGDKKDTFYWESKRND